MKLLAAASSLALCACAPGFDHLEYSPIGGVPGGVRLEPTLVSVPVGVSVAARVAAVNDEGSVMACEPTLVSDDEKIMKVERADRGSTVFSGIAAGETPIAVHCGGEDGLITGRVTTP